MNLTIDIGNTRTKVIVFDDTVPVYRHVSSKITLSFLRRLLKTYPVNYSICSRVVDVDPRILQLLKSIPNYISFKDSMPVKNRYKTPATLGNDRLANAVAAAFLFPRKNVLVIDAGTCVKCDVVNDRGEYLGGSISPGMEMRFRALHHLTGKLPLSRYARVRSFIGNSTETAIQSGVVIGMQEEINGFINLYRSRFKGLKIIVTGGDAKRFVNDLNLSIFAAADLVNIGLNEIIRFNSR